MKTIGRVLVTLLNTALLVAFIAAGVFAWHHQPEIRQVVTYHKTGVLYPQPEDIEVEIQDLAGNVLFRGTAAEQQRAMALFAGAPEIHDILFDFNFRLGTGSFALKVDPTGDRGWLTSEVTWTDLQPYLVTDNVELEIDRPAGEDFRGTVKSYVAKVEEDGKLTPFGQSLEREKPAHVSGIMNVRHPEHIRGRVRVESIYDPR